MSVSAALLRELHRLHRQATDLRSRIAQGPRQIAAAEGSVKRLEEELVQGKGALTQAKVAADEKQLQLKSREARIKDLRLKLNAASSNREYQALLEQIAADEQANGVLSDEILDALEGIDRIQAGLAKTDQNIKKTKAELARVQETVGKQRAELEGELQRIMGELTAAEVNLPDDFRPEYLRMATVRGENALAPIDGECCGGCYHTITVQTRNELYLERVVHCKNCGCILYLPEDHTRK